MIRQKQSRKPARVHRRPRGLKKILVALDGSAEGEAILHPLKEILAPGAHLILIHVIPVPPPSSGPLVEDLLRAEEESEQYLEKIQSRFPRIRSKVIVETGDPAERIVATAKAENVDALAMTTHARGGLTAILMGSVAREIVQRAGRPVLLVRPDVAPPRRPRHRIVVPLAGPEGADELLRIVEPLAKQKDAEVLLLHVLPFPRVADPVTGFTPIVLRPMQLPDAGWLDPLVDLLSHHGIRADKRVLAGEPDEVLVRECRSLNVDLIALRTRGRGGFARLILGSVAEKVLQNAGRPVLLFHRVEEK